jgi:phage-related tail fiber protein
VFAREDGAPVRPETVSERLPALCKAAGVRRIRVHDLRHTAATLMIRSGVPLVTVSKILRHKTYGFTADTYGHLTEEIATEAAATYGAMLDAATAERAAIRAVRERTHDARSTEDAPTMRSNDHVNDNGGSPFSENRQVIDGAPDGIRTPNLLIRSSNASDSMCGMAGGTPSRWYPIAQSRYCRAPVRGHGCGQRSTG